eukprot:11774432-Alexandrium_andersonii.AAC.1
MRSRAAAAMSGSVDSCEPHSACCPPSSCTLWCSPRTGATCLSVPRHWAHTHESHVGHRKVATDLAHHLPQGHSRP